MLITIIILVTIPTTVTPLIVTSNNISTVPLNTHHNHHGEESSETAPAATTKCQEITIPMCKTIRYNYTEMPNSFNHETQEEAGLEVHQYWPLVEINCSPDLKFFICSIYVPICMEDYLGTVPPCREVCERAKAGCEPVMRPYGFEWPQRMTCEQFPTYGKHSICMDERNGELPREQQQNHHHNSNSNMHNHVLATNTKTSSPHGNDHYQKSPKNTNKPPPSSNACSKQRASCTCPSPLVTVNNSVCSHPCYAYGYASQEETNFAQIWLTFWSSTTLALSTITVFTFAINPTRFNYPERPIILISFSYVFVSIAYLIRIYYGHEVTACEGMNYEVIKYPGNNVRFHHQSPSQQNSSSCLITFLLSYYFTISGSCWYVVLTTTWYLASVLKWSTESISSYSKLFHLLVWTVSGTLTTRVLATNSVDGDGVSGLCGVGNQDNDNLLYYVVYPIGSMLCVGSVFLVSGFVSLVSLRRSMQRGGGSGRLVMRNFHKLEKLMMRIGVFGIIYSLDVGAVIGGLLYEGFWVKVNYDQVGSCECNDNEDVKVTNSNGIMRPAYSLLMIKHFMSLATGLTASIWVFSSKTIETWKHFIKSKLLCYLCKSSSSSTAASDKQRLGVAIPTTAPAAATSTSTGTNSSLQNNTANYRLQIHNASASSVHNHHHHHHFNSSLGNGGGGSSTINHSNTQTHV